MELSPPDMVQAQLGLQNTLVERTMSCSKASPLFRPPTGLTTFNELEWQGLDHFAPPYPALQCYPRVYPYLAFMTSRVETILLHQARLCFPQHHFTLCPSSCSLLRTQLNPTPHLILPALRLLEQVFSRGLCLLHACSCIHALFSSLREHNRTPASTHPVFTLPA